MRFVHRDGSRAGGFKTDGFRRATGGRFTSLPRSDLAEVLWNALPESVETRFGDEVVRLEPAGDRIRAHFAHSAVESFDLVIGADGLHSKVRELLFGPEEKFETFLGYAFAAFTVAGYRPRTADTYIGHGVPGRQISRVSMREDRTLALLIWHDKSSNLPASEDARRALLRQRFAGTGWESGRILKALDRATDLYLDSVSQIHLPRWSQGRVALVGDAAWAPSFLAGEGCGLGIIGAYVLAGEIARSGGDPIAFERYEARLRAFIETKQKMAARFGGAFCPRTRFGVIFRNWIANLLNIGPIADLALARELKDQVELPDYEAEAEKPSETAYPSSGPA